MEPDDLLCSRNARPQKALVGRAQWKINQPPSLKREQASLRGHVYCSMRPGESNLATLLSHLCPPFGMRGKKKQSWEGLRMMRAIENTPASCGGKERAG
jgi:hypothetical protein